MILGNVKNRARYKDLGEDIMQALDYFASVLENPASVPDETADIPLPGGKVLIRVRPMNSKPESEGLWEAHYKELDIHFVAYGTERIGVADAAALTVARTDEANDVYFLDGPTEDFVTLRPGTFLIVYPEDAHMPCIAADEPAPIGKLIAKMAAAKI